MTVAAAAAAAVSGMCRQQPGPHMDLLRCSIWDPPKTCWPSSPALTTDQELHNSLVHIKHGKVSLYQETRRADLVSQQVKLLLELLASHSGKQLTRFAQVLGPLTPIWRTWMKFLAPGPALDIAGVLRVSQQVGTLSGHHPSLVTTMLMDSLAPSPTSQKGEVLSTDE